MRVQGMVACPLDGIDRACPHIMEKHCVCVCVYSGLGCVEASCGGQTGQTPCVTVCGVMCVQGMAVCLLDVIDKACPHIVEKLLPHLPLQEKVKEI